MARNTKYKKAYRASKKALRGKSPIYVILAALLISGWYAFDSWQASNKTLQSDNNITLSACTDGDTAHFQIDGKDTKVRFLAIDTPESVKQNHPVELYGKEASKYTCNALENAKEIRLEYEDNASKDKYERILAWVFVDGELLQEKLVEEGLAEVAYLYDDYKYTSQLQTAQKTAQKKKLGIWSDN